MNWQTYLRSLAASFFIALTLQRKWKRSHVDSRSACAFRRSNDASA